jgi:quercetin dioxygenase-like cupin family protein
VAFTRLKDIKEEAFHDGAVYQTLVGDDNGSTPVRLGIQTSPPGFSTGDHYHPYWEYVTVLEGEGMGWIEGENNNQEFSITTGDTMSFPPGVLHRFRATGERVLKTYGVHLSSERVVVRD